MEALNILAVALFFFEIFLFYNQCRTIFPLLVFPLYNMVWLLMSSSYIENGIYIADIDMNSYSTGATWRLFLLDSFFMLLFFILNKFWPPKKMEVKTFPAENGMILLVASSFYDAYLFLNTCISGNVLTNEAITRFNFYTEYSLLPLSQQFAYLMVPVQMINGVVFSSTKSKAARSLSLLNLLISLLTLYLTGEQFTGFLNLVLCYSIPNLVCLMVKSVKLIKLKNIVFILTVFCLATLPKLAYFDTNGIYGVSSSAYDTPLKKLAYRALALQGDIWWEIDRQVYEDSAVEPSQFSDEVSAFFDDSGKTDAGIWYLMKRAMPTFEYYRYLNGNGTLNGGYPAIYVAIFGYGGAAVCMALDAFVYFCLIRYMVVTILKKRCIRLFLAANMYISFSKMLYMGGVWMLGNRIPLASFFLLLFIEVCTKAMDKRNYPTIKINVRKIDYEKD